MSTTYGVLYDVVAAYEETTLESHISMTDETSLPFTFGFRDSHIKIMRSSDVQLIESRLFAVKKEVFPLDSLYSYETLKPCILDVLLNMGIHIDIYSIERLKEGIAIPACGMFRDYQARKVRIKGFIVEIEFQTMQECEEDEDTMMREIIEATMDMGPAMVPASKDSIEKLLNTRKFEKEEIGEACTVCLEEFLVGLEVKEMPCGHAFHGDCIIKWLQQSHFCPLCRFSMPVDAD